MQSPGRAIARFEEELFMTARVLTSLLALGVVGNRPDPTTTISVGSIAAQLDVALSSASRVCTELEQLGMLRRAGTPGAYRIGPAAVELSGRAASPYAHAVRYALTLMAQQTGETACLAAGAPGRIRIVASIASAWTLHAPGDVGEAITGADSAIARVARGERPSGNATCVESTIGASVEVAVPVLDAAGRPRAVLAVRMPTNRAGVGVPRARRALLLARRSIEQHLDADTALAARGQVRSSPPASSLAAAFDVVRHLSRHPDSISGTARAVGLSFDRAQRLIEHCRIAGFVDVDPGRDVTVDWGLHGWYRAAMSPTLRAHVAPLVSRTADEFQVCTFITVLRGMRSVTLIEELRDVGPGLRMLPWLGRPAPITESDGGPALVSDLAADELASVFPRRHSPSELEAFAKRVRRVARNGVIAHESLEDAGIVSISAPIRDSSGTVAAAVCIVGPRDRVRPQLEALSNAARDLAAEASAILLFAHP
jgi:DNA-binding IclR family transcriptional regulator